MPYAPQALESSYGPSELVTNQDNLATTSSVEQSALASIPWQSVVNEASYYLSVFSAMTWMYDELTGLAKDFKSTVDAASSKLTELAETAVLNANNSPTSFVQSIQFFKVCYECCLC